jgi:hypothetical protein
VICEEEFRRDRRLMLWVVKDVQKKEGMATRIVNIDISDVFVIHMVHACA